MSAHSSQVWQGTFSDGACSVTTSLSVYVYMRYIHKTHNIAFYTFFDSFTVTVNTTISILPLFIYTVDFFELLVVSDLSISTYYAKYLNIYIYYLDTV